MSTPLIAITGGIGAGKSVISHILQCMGYQVYDCDSRAKAIIGTVSELQQQIREQICADAFLADGTYNREAVSACVFADKTKMERLNSLVHAAVFKDIELWRNKSASNSKSPLFVESAILYTSELWRAAKPDCAWIVTAPEELRIHRVMQRNGLTANQIKARIAAQSFEPDKYPLPYSYISNDNVTAILPQVAQLLLQWQ